MKATVYKNKIGEMFYYRSTSPNDFFEILLCGTTPPCADYSIYRSVQPFYVLEYVVSGKGAIDCRNTHWEVEAGDVYFLRKGASVHYYANPEDPFHKLWINFRGRLIDELVEIYGIHEDALVRRQQDGRIGELLTAIHERLQTTEEAELEALRECSVKVMEIFSLLMCKETLAYGCRPVTTAEKIKQYVDMRLYEDLTLADIAEYCCLHEVYVIRLFRRQYGVTPMRYLGRRRIEIACRMIEEGRMSIKEIAAALHYADGPYFSGRFKKEMGISPSEYREKLMQEQKLNEKL